MIFIKKIDRYSFVMCLHICAPNVLYYVNVVQFYGKVSHGESTLRWRNVLYLIDSVFFFFHVNMLAKFGKKPFTDKRYILVYSNFYLH